METTMAKDVTNTSNLSVDDISVQLAVLKDDIASLTSTMADLTKAKSAEACQPGEIHCAGSGELRP
jgi:uncharacterized small protein (DUF1192 family)